MKPEIKTQMSPFICYLLINIISLRLLSLSYLQRLEVACSLQFQKFNSTNLCTSAIYKPFWFSDYGKLWIGLLLLLYSELLLLLTDLY